MTPAESPKAIKKSAPMVPRIDERDYMCNVMGSILHAHVTEGLVRSWDEKVVRPSGILVGDEHSDDDDYTDEIHLWGKDAVEAEFGPGEFRQSALHEGAHLLGYDDDNDAQDIAEYCG